MIIKSTSLVCSLPDDAQNKLIAELKKILKNQGFSKSNIEKKIEDVYSRQLSYVSSMIDISPFLDPLVLKWECESPCSLNNDNY